MSDTGWNVEVRTPAWTYTMESSRIASLPEAVADALRQAGLGNEFCGSFQITVTSGQLEPAGSDSEPEPMRCTVSSVTTGVQCGHYFGHTGPHSCPEPHVRCCCPDSGACHHDCGNGPCFRVQCCEPLSAAGWGDKWPPAIRRVNRELSQRCKHGELRIMNCHWCNEEEQRSKSATARAAVPPSR